MVCIACVGGLAPNANHTAFTAELQAAVDGIRNGKEPELLSGKLARDGLVLCHKECQSVRTGKSVVV
jgi:hypothetical protein